jgi:hypothetical protein
LGERVDERVDEWHTEDMETNCEHENTRQIDEHDVECLDCGVMSA